MFKLTIATPDRYLYRDEEIQSVTLPGHVGELNVLPGHAPLMTTLEPGILSLVDKSGNKTSIAIYWGYCQVSAEGVNVLAEMAETREEIDVENVKSAREEAEKALATELMDEDGFEQYFKRLKREEVRYAFANMD